MADEKDELRKIKANIDAVYARLGKEAPRKLIDTADLEEAKILLTSARAELNSMETSASGLYASITNIVKELSNQNTNLNRATSSLRTQEDISRKLAFNEQGVAALSVNQLKTLQRKQAIQSTLFRENAQALAEELGIRGDIADLSDPSKVIEEAVEANTSYTAAQKKRAIGILSAYADEKNAINEINSVIQDQIDFENKVSSAIGLTGAAFENLNKIGVRAFGGLGINLGTLQEGFESANEAMRAQAISDMDKEMGSFAKRTRTLTAGLQVLGPSLKDTFTDPLILANGLANAFFDIDKAATSLANTTGQTFKAFDGLTGRFATAVDLAEVIVAETEQSGLNANNIFSKDVLAGAAEFKNLVGGSAEEIAGLLSLTAATGMNTDLIQESIVDTTSAFNEANRAAISQRRVLQDVLTTSNSVKASLAGNPTALAEAASAARRLGLSLSEVDSIASSLIDFESSITAELEAQLLTGRNLNLSKARELALNNDLAGLSNEIFKNQVSVAEFSQMNRIQQEGLAKALGMSRDQLANMAFQQAKMNGLTNEAAAAAAGVSLSDMQRAEAVEALQKTLTALLQTLAPALNLISSFVGSIAKFPILTMSVIGLGIAFKSLGIPIFTAIGNVTKLSTGFAALKAKIMGTAVVTKIQTAAQSANTAASAAQTASNAALSASQTTVGSTSKVAAKGLSTLGSAGSVALPILLGIGAAGVGIGAAFAGIGFAIKNAAEGIVMLTKALTSDNVQVLSDAATAIAKLSLALGSFALTGVLALPALLAVTPLITALSPAGAAGEAEGQNAMAKIEEKLDTLIGAVKEDRVVKVSIDSKEIIEAIVLKDYS